MVKNLEHLPTSPFFDDRDAGERVDIVLKALIEQIRNKVQFYQPPAVKLTKANQTVTTGGAGAVLTWDAEVFDYDNMFDSASSTTDIVIPEDGMYVALCHTRWSGGTWSNAQVVRLEVLVDGTVVALAQTPGAGGSQARTRNVMTVLELLAGQVITFRGFQNSGGNRQVDGADDATFCSVYQLNPQR